MKRNILIAFILIIYIFFSNSCINIKFSDKKTGKDLYEEFFIDKGVTQYFIKPIKFKSDEFSYIVDFTFRDTATAKSYIIANFSIYSNEKTEVYDSIGFYADNVVCKFINPVKLYIDADKNLYIRRFTAYLKYDEMKKLFSSENMRIFISSNNKLNELLPTKSTKKHISLINDNLLEFIELN